jgi:hypothetical protein
MPGLSTGRVKIHDMEGQVHPKSKRVKVGTCPEKVRLFLSQLPSRRGAFMRRLRDGDVGVKKQTIDVEPGALALAMSMGDFSATLLVPTCPQECIN